MQTSELKVLLEDHKAQIKSLIDLQISECQDTHLASLNQLERSKIREFEDRLEIRGLQAALLQSHDEQTKLREKLLLGAQKLTQTTY